MPLALGDGMPNDHWMARLQFMLVVALVTTGSRAHAEEPPDSENVEPSSTEPGAEAKKRTFDFTDRPIAFGLGMGIATPVGLIGLLGDYTPEPHVAIGGGIGTNLQGMQATVLMRGRPFVWPRRSRVLAITLGGAFSTGPYREADFGLGEARAIQSTDRANWIQLDVGFELRNRTGFQLLVATGGAWMTNPGSLSCSSSVSPCSGARSYWLPTATVMLGTSF